MQKSKNVKKKERSKNSSLSSNSILAAARMKRLELAIASLVNKTYAIKKGVELPLHDQRFVERVLEAFQENYEKNSPEFFTAKMTTVLVLGDAYDLPGEHRDAQIERIIERVDAGIFGAKINDRPRTKYQREMLKRKPFLGAGKRKGLRLAIDNIPYLFDAYSKSSFERDQKRYWDYEKDQREHYAKDFDFHELAKFALSTLFGYSREPLLQFERWSKQFMSNVVDSNGLDRPINSGEAMKKAVTTVDNMETVARQLSKQK